MKDNVKIHFFWGGDSMSVFLKSMFMVFLSVMMLSGCGNGDENATTNEHEDDEGVAEAEGDNHTIEQVEDETNETSNEERGSDEVVPEPVKEREEREGATAKDDHYMQAGTFVGGEITDGRVVGNIDSGIHDEYERLVLDIYEGAYEELGDPADTPNHFEVTMEAYPSRFVYTLHGIRGQPDELPDLTNMEYLSFMEMIPYFDDATIQLAMYAKESVEFEVFEMHNPAKIVTDVRLIESEVEYATVYSIRTPSFPQKEFTETYQSAFGERGAEQVRTLHSGDATIFVEEGYYSTLEEAEERKEVLENDGIDFELHIEERGMQDFPENIQ